MGLLNNFGEYNAEEEAERRAQNLRLLEENSKDEEEDSNEDKNTSLSK